MKFLKTLLMSTLMCLTIQSQAQEIKNYDILIIGDAADEYYDCLNGVYIQYCDQFQCSTINLGTLTFPAVMSMAPPFVGLNLAKHSGAIEPFEDAGDKWEVIYEWCCDGQRLEVEITVEDFGSTGLIQIIYSKLEEPC